MNIKPSTTVEARIKLQPKLLIAEKQVAEGAPLLDHDQVIASMRRKINAAKA